MNKGKGSIKCLVWDLDNTLWDGILLEDETVHLKENIPEIIKTLDKRGILQSIASKNHYETAISKLTEFGLAEYFLYPQIHWNSKAQSIKKIADSINIGFDSIAVIDDQPFELDEIKHSFPEVVPLNAADLPQLLEMDIMNPRFITDDLQMRRQLYLTDMARKKAADEFTGPQEDFLASLHMKLTVSRAEEKDLQRAEELTVRTNQLNATGYTYSYEELNDFRMSPDHLLLMAKLHDRYGSYGYIGLLLVECRERVWTIKLLLMSCRVISRGVGSIMLNHIMQLAGKEGVILQAEFVPNDRNRMMNITYRFSNFHKVGKNGNTEILQNDLQNIPAYPDYVTVNIQ